MSQPAVFLLVIVVSYASGSIPSAYLAGKARGIDLREHGSGNLGATNVIRVLGPRIGALVFAVDVIKGALPVLLLPRLVLAAPPSPGSHWFLGAARVETIAIICGIAAIIGHVRPVFLGFGRGGKGVATAAGVFLGLAPVAALASLATFAGILAATGFVSLGSLAGATMLPIAILLSEGAGPVLAVGLLVTLFVFWTHRANIARLQRGEEHRFPRFFGIGSHSRDTRRAGRGEPGQTARRRGDQ